MQPEARREALDWLARADIDLRIAERSPEAPPIPGGAAYHAQQAAEKALKAFLAAHGEAFRRTHDVAELLTLCARLEPAFHQFDRAAQTLSPYASEFRYPGGALEPALLDAAQACGDAREMVDAVLRSLAM